MNSSRIKVWLEGAIAASFSMALSLIPLDVGIGFSISIGMIPVVIYSFRRGFLPGLASGFIWGLLHILLGKAYILTVSQGLIEYLLAFGCAGFAGLYAGKIQTLVKNGETPWMQLLFGVLLGTGIRYIWHFIAGVIFWGQFAAWGLSPVMYSLVINGTNALLTAAATFIVTLLLVKKSPGLVLLK
ncbi:energy-coupled thiamine transporter ThiT [Vagococcus fluvialis]|uniref:energy-coupled thiamine transporter ThiT n=1 Tax=Vagococcus fluvialis TaxID=2738 RepID=UPI003B21ACC4